MSFENGRVVRVALSATSGDDAIVNTFHYDVDNGDIIDPDPSMQTLADTFRDDVIPSYRPLFTDSWVVQPVIVTEEKDPLHPDDPRSSWSSGSPLVGTHLDVTGTDPAPQEMCGLATWVTGSIGRSFRGRSFLPPLWNKTFVVGQTIQSAQITTYTNFLDDVPIEPDVALGGSGGRCRLTVFSRTRRGRNQTPYLSDITGFTLSTQVRFLRSRTPGS